LGCSALLGRLRTRVALAVAVREAVLRAGPAAVMLAGRMAFRLDLVPPEVSFELEQLVDRVDPFPIEDAVARVERAAGRPIAEVFETFDPEPISSTMMGCEYQAVRRDGRRVVVRVRRPGVRRQLASALQAMGVVLRALEVLTLVRPGFFAVLSDEVRDLIAEDSDFRLMARYQQLFRSRARRDGIKQVTAPRVHRDLQSEEVMVTEFVSGVWLHEVIAAVEDQDRATLWRLREMDVDPKAVAEALFQVKWWELTDSLFCHTELRANHVVVRPGGQLVLVRFSDCDSVSARLRTLHRELYRRLAEDDVSGAADLMVQMVSPLPLIDTYGFSKRIEARLWHHLFALQDRGAQPWERTSVGCWLALFDAVRAEGLPVRQEVVSLARSSVLFDGLIFGVDGGLRPLSAFRRFERQADRRVARAFARQAGRTLQRDLRPALLARVARFSRVVGRGQFYLETAVESLPVSQIVLAGKAATVAAELVQAAFTGLATWALGTAGWAITLA
ncbi:MAG TPA: AarF/UbiB family protein, partial [Myxococcota bacterium]|nr:AarF/UbiB family protein [Myxococcota bacterium]